MKVNLHLERLESRDCPAQLWLWHRPVITPRPAVVVVPATQQVVHVPQVVQQQVKAVVVATVKAVPAVPVYGLISIRVFFARHW